MHCHRMQFPCTSYTTACSTCVNDSVDLMLISHMVAVSRRVLKGLRLKVKHNRFKAPSWA
jgi:hypothetical protein